MKIEFKMIDVDNEILDWCCEQFGNPNQLKNSRWFTARPPRGESSYVCRRFEFHYEEDAMAFKLRWA